MRAIGRKEIHYWAYIFAFSLIVVGMPLSRFLVSMGGLFLALNWLTAPGLIARIREFFHNRIALILSSLYALHLLGLLWTSDLEFGFADLQTKIPILFIPLIFSSLQPFQNKHIHLIMQVFVLSVLTATLAGIVNYAGLSWIEVVDIRDITPFVSHIRLALFICLAIFYLIHRLFNPENKPLLKFAGLLIIIWLFGYMLITESLTGIIILLVSGVILLVYKGITHKRRPVKATAWSLMAIGTAALAFFLHGTLKNYEFPVPKEETSYESHTPRGNPYEHQLHDQQTENGNYLLRYVCWDEMKESWNQRSKLSFDSLDLLKQPLKYTLIRYLSSRGLRKDADGVAALSDNEIAAIEKGTSNFLLLQKMNFLQRIKYRIVKFAWAYEVYRKTGDPSGYSLMQRVEYWRAAYHIIKRNPVIGVGTGDIKNAFRDEYIIMNSKLHENLRHRAHNQYLAIAISFGVLGLLVFLFVLIYPLFIKPFPGFMFGAFTIILLLSMLTEDTIESQAGVTFYAFFSGFFLFVYNKTCQVSKT
ncbi:MAG: O-antigen ligase family protein [Bacteroidetes bacterium]|nr:O-antigen ligase family protein [Bacteroidota bacterium]MBU1720479.1 O-antigen ligase family protein [Bacteroidota bacterium]